MAETGKNQLFYPPLAGRGGLRGHGAAGTGRGHVAPRGAGVRRGEGRLRRGRRWGWEPNAQLQVICTRKGHAWC